MANFGIGLGAFTQGLNQGMDTGSRIKEMRQKQDFQKFKQGAFDEAKSARQADLASGKQGVGDLQSYYMKTSAPKIRDYLLEQGEVEKAQGWDKWLKDDKVQQGVNSWSKMVQSFSMGDYEQAVGYLKDTYNNSGYYDNGVEVVAHQVNDNGGVTATFKTADGKEFTQDLGDIEQVMRTNIMAMSPEGVFDYGTKTLTAIDAARAEDRKLQSKHAQQVALENVKQGNRYGLANHKANVELQLAFSKRELQLGGGYLKEKSPRARLDYALNMLNKERAYQPEWKTLSSDEKVAVAQELLSAVDRAVAE